MVPNGPILQNHVLSLLIPMVLKLTTRNHVQKLGFILQKIMTTVPVVMSV